MHPQMTQMSQIEKASADDADASDCKRHPQMTQMPQIAKGIRR
jgi:hypothetical protein